MEQFTKDVRNKKSVCIVTPGADHPIYNPLARRVGTKRRGGFFFFCLLITLCCSLLAFPLSGYAKNMQTALDEAANLLHERADSFTSLKRMIVRVVNKHSGQSDGIAKRIQTVLNLALQDKFMEITIVFAEDALTGVTSRGTVFIEGVYEKKGEMITLTIRALKGLQTGESLAQTEVEFDIGSTRRKTLVAVLDLDSRDLTESQRKAFSDIFRSIFVEIDAFDIASSADVDKMSPDEIQKQTGCTRDQCATIIGERLGGRSCHLQFYLYGRSRGLYPFS